MEERGTIRVLHVIGNMERGGAESMLMSLVRHIDRTRIQFDYVVHTDRECAFDAEIGSLGGSIFHCPRYTIVNHFEYVRWWNHFFASHPEYMIIHGHQRSTASIYLGIAKKRGLATIAHSHAVSSRGGLLERAIKSILQHNIRYIADWFMACSPEAGRWLFGKEIVAGDRFILLKNAIEVDRFVFDSTKREAVRKEFGIENHIVFGHVGNFTPVKNHEFLIGVFRAILRINKDAKLLLVGTGECKRQTEESVRSLGMDDKVIFVGARDDVADMLQAMDVFVFPSQREGFGIALLEAQAADLPIVASDSVPREVAITERIVFVPLSDGAQIWADKAIAKAEMAQRRDRSSELRSAGYDVAVTAPKLASFYENIDPQGRGRLSNNEHSPRISKTHDGGM